MPLSLARPRFRWGIASILTLSMVSVIAVLMATTALLDIRRERAIFHGELEQQALLIASTLEDVLSDAFYFENTEELEDFAQVIVAELDIRNLQLFRPGREPDGGHPAGRLPHRHGRGVQLEGS